MRTKKSKSPGKHNWYWGPEIHTIFTSGVLLQASFSLVAWASCPWASELHRVLSQSMSFSGISPGWGIFLKVQNCSAMWAEDVWQLGDLHQKFTFKANWNADALIECCKGSEVLFCWNRYPILWKLVELDHYSAFWLNKPLLDVSAFLKELFKLFFRENVHSWRCSRLDWT